MNKSKKNKNSRRINKNSRRINKNSRRINTNTKRINTNTKRINTNTKRIGNVKVLTLDGNFTTIDTEILHEGKDFFRKMTNDGEKKICDILMQNPHKNIIKIYYVGKDDENYIDMELLLNTDINLLLKKTNTKLSKTNTKLLNTNMYIQDISKIKNVMMEVKTYLQSLGIIYIDWKLDNIGISDDKEIKLFDFNASGLIDIETKKWIIKPPEWWSYNEAIENGMVNPIDIDNYAFDIEFKNAKYN